MRELDPDKLALAADLGADLGLLAGDESLVTLGLGGHADVVFDFVGTDETLDYAARNVEPGGLISLVGEAGGHLSFGFDRPPVETFATTTAWGSLADLREVVRLASRGRLRWSVERMPLRKARSAHDRLLAGTVKGRIVLTPVASDESVAEEAPHDALRLLRRPHVPRPRHGLVRLAHGGRGQIGHGQVATAGQVLVGQRMQAVAHLVEGGEVGAVAPAGCPPSSPSRRAAPTLARPVAARPARAAAPRRTAAGPRSAPRAAAARRTDGARAWPRAWWGRCPAARKGSTAAGTSICAGAPGSMITRSPAASARAKTSRAGSSIASLPGGPNSRNASGEV